MRPRDGWAQGKPGNYIRVEGGSVNYSFLKPGFLPEKQTADN